MQDVQKSVGVILGSAFYEGLEGELKPINVQTAFGHVLLFQRERASGTPAYVLFRHGVPHSTLPHQINYRANEFARRLDNTAIQEVRAEVQYRGLAATLDDPRFDEPAEWVASRLSRCAGECMILGDLWPASLLLNRESWGVIDLEFAHWGFPEQDLAHLLAHLRMWTLCSVNSAPIEAFAAELTDAYFEVSSWQEENFKAANIHFGFEILARAIGPFKSGYLFENASLADINTAKSVAKRAIIGPHKGIGCYKVS